MATPPLKENDQESAQQHSDTRDKPSPSNGEDVQAELERSVARITELTTQRDEILSVVKEQLRHGKESVPPLDHPEIEKALEDFLDFFEGYTDFFWNESQCHGRTYESTLNRALDITRQMWQQLSLAINQRYNPAYRDKLKQADGIAAEMLGQVGGMVKGRPILYFDKSFQISRHPYQTYPLLGISRDRFESDRHASLAHELGHHVFWNNGELEEYAKRLDLIDEQIAHLVFDGKFPAGVNLSDPAITQNEIRILFDQYTIWIGWIEEVFADVFGTLIIGPRFAKSAQDVLVRERVGRRDELLTSDGDHPVPALRPYIATATLQVVAGLQTDAFCSELEKLVAELERRWDTAIWEDALKEERQSQSKAPVGDHLEHGGTHEQPVATLADLRSLVVPVVELVLRKATFATGVDGTSPTNLLEAVTYWGKEPTEEDVASIQGLLEDLKSDPINALPERKAPAGNSRQEPIGGTRSFDRYRRFVVDRLKAKDAQSAQTVDDCEAVLGFDLALEHGAHDYCKCHPTGGSGCRCGSAHYHSTTRGVVSC